MPAFKFWLLKRHEMYGKDNYMHGPLKHQGQLKAAFNRNRERQSDDRK